MLTERSLGLASEYDVGSAILFHVVFQAYCSVMDSGNVRTFTSQSVGLFGSVDQQLKNLVEPTSWSIQVPNCWEDACIVSVMVPVTACCLRLASGTAAKIPDRNGAHMCVDSCRYYNIYIHTQISIDSVCVYIYTHTHIHILRHTYIYIYIYIYTHTCVYGYMLIYLFMHLLCVCVSVCKCVCVCVRLPTC